MGREPALQFDMRSDSEFKHSLSQMQLCGISSAK